MTREELINRIEELTNKYIKIDLMSDHIEEWQDREQRKIIAEKRRLQTQLETMKA